MVAVVAAARDGRRRSLVGPGLHPHCGLWTLLGVDQWGVDQWRCALALACAQPQGCTRSIHATDTPSENQTAFSPTPARREPACPAPAAGQPCRQPAGTKPAPQGTDRTGGWGRAACAAWTARPGVAHRGATRPYVLGRRSRRAGQAALG